MTDKSTNRNKEKRRPISTKNHEVFKETKVLFINLSKETKQETRQRLP